MTGKKKFFAALAVIYAFLACLVIIIHAILWATLAEQEKDVLLPILEERTAAAFFLVILALSLIGLAFASLYRRHVNAPLKLREQLLLMLGPNRHARLSKSGSEELQALTAEINCLADQRDELDRQMSTKIRDANAEVEEEKNRLAALVAEFGQSVVVCNIDGRIVLYNHRARHLFKTMNGDTPLGLGRSIYSMMEHNLLAHALDRMRLHVERNDMQASAGFVTSSRSGQLIRVQMSPVFDLKKQSPVHRYGQHELSGYILILEDITSHLDIQSRRDQMLQSLTEENRASLASISAAVDNLLNYPDMEEAQRDRFMRIMRDEADVMSRRLNQTSSEFADAVKIRWPLEEMLGSDLINAAQRRIERRLDLPTRIEEMTAGLWIKADSFSLIQGLSCLAARLKEEFGVREVRFRLLQHDRLASLDLIWSGVVIGTETLLAWELEPMSAGGENSPLTLREVVERHGGELWAQREKATHRAFFRILLPTATAPDPFEIDPSPHGSRPEYYDFDLFRQTDETRALDDCPLDHLTYTAFDTETTGLEPSSGDEIIQIGAVRILNGRMLTSEVFDQLLDPQRSVSTESTRIHGFTREMLSGRPTIDRVLPQFHAFCEDTVLLAHNAAFDMRFLQMKEEATGIIFNQPVLDTLLLSAVIHPHQESHRLEAIAERFGVNIIARHTALGDAMVTGEIFLKMVPLLAERGIHTLRDARQAAAQTYYARVKY